MKKFNISKIIGAVFIIVAIIIIAITVVLNTFVNNMYKNYKTTSAVITNIETYYKHSSSETLHDVYISYSVNGIDYENVEINYYSSFMYIGKTITVYYNVNNPSDIILDKNVLLTLTTSIPIGIAIIFLIVGIILIVVEIRKKNKYKNLVLNGIRLQAPISRVHLNYSIRINRMHPYIVECEYTDNITLQKMFFKSGNTFINPLSEGRQYINIYIDRNNPNNYFMDLKDEAINYIEGKI